MTRISCKHVVISALLGSVSFPSAQAASIQFLGDFYLSDHVLNTVSEKDQKSHVLQGLESELRKGDFNMVNLEGAITESHYFYPFKSYNLKMPFQTARVLGNAGITAASLANNHIMDYGYFGLFDTVAELNRYNIHHVGAGVNIDEAKHPLSIKIKGKKVCFLSYSRTLPEGFWAEDERPGTANLSYEELQSAVGECASTHDATFVSFHWGEEESKRKKDYQAELARLVIDAGATGVIGHHPHVLQEVEFYKQGFIIYSQGNSAFGTYPVSSQPEGMMVRVILNQKRNLLQLVGLEVNNHVVEFIPQRKNDKFDVDFINDNGRCRWSSARLWECPI
ncbi:MAG: CapA family protein [Oligoflexales bacterium]